MSSPAFIESDNIWDDNLPNTFPVVGSSEGPPLSQSPTTSYSATMQRQQQQQQQQQQPRFVSDISLSQAMFSVASRPLKTSSTPYARLKELALSKQPRNVLLYPKKRPMECQRIASIFGKPSTTLLNLVSGNPPPSKRRRSEEIPQTSNALHHACCNPAHLTLEKLNSLLTEDPKAVCRPVTLPKSKMVYNIRTGKVEDKQEFETYKYPLNIAIEHKASSEVIERLINVAPFVLAQVDGPKGSRKRAIHVLLKHKPDDIKTAVMMLVKAPESALATDEQGNTPLHTAIMNGASLNTVRLLVKLQPAALRKQNKFGYCPLRLAQTLSLTSDKICDFLWKALDKQF